MSNSFVLKQRNTFFGIELNVNKGFENKQGINKLGLREQNKKENKSKKQNFRDIQHLNTTVISQS